MRLLGTEELSIVSGGCTNELGCDTGRNNNGYGNGAESGPPPGNSGDHNPQLTEWNLGPRGAR